MRRPVRHVAGVLVISMLIALAAACGDDDATAPPDPNERLTDIYAAAIEAVAADVTTLPTEDDDDVLTVFVAEHDDAQISADVQLGVVAALESWASVRFIDSLDEAIDRGADGEPVRGDGILVGLGEVSDGEASATLVADRYEGEGTTIVYDLQLTRRAGEWSVTTPLDGVAVDAP